MTRDGNGANPLRINVGCGSSPTPGWKNFDNSPSVRLARFPALVGSLVALGLINDEQRRFSRLAARNGIIWADAARRLPLETGSVAVAYSSHMIEHLDRHAALSFLAELWRVLAPGGVLRLVVPDLRQLAVRYLEKEDADAFVEGSLLAGVPPHTIVERLKWLFTGPRHHLWMYDGRSLLKMLVAVGYESPVILPAGETTVPEPGALDLYERREESVYVEARKPVDPSSTFRVPASSPVLNGHG